MTGKAVRCQNVQCPDSAYDGYFCWHVPTVRGGVIEYRAVLCWKHGREILDKGGRWYGFRLVGMLGWAA